MSSSYSSKSYKSELKYKPRFIIYLLYSGFSRENWDLSMCLMDNLGHFKSAHIRKTWDILIGSVSRLHDNGPPHTAIITKGNFKTLEYSAYSSNCLMCEYHMFGPFRKELKALLRYDDWGVKLFVSLIATRHEWPTLLVPESPEIVFSALEIRQWLRQFLKKFYFVNKNWKEVWIICLEKYIKWKLCRKTSQRRCVSQPLRSAESWYHLGQNIYD